MSQVRDYITAKDVPVDSLELMDLIMEIEEEFDILLDMNEITSLDELIVAAEEKINEIK